MSAVAEGSSPSQRGSWRRVARVAAPLLLLATVWGIGLPSARRMRASGVGSEAAGGRASDLGTHATEPAQTDDGLPEDWEAAMWPMLDVPELGPDGAPKAIAPAGDGREWIGVTAGVFTMGDAGLPGVGPARQLALPAFEIQRTEFTWGQLRRLCDRWKTDPQKLPGSLCDLPSASNATLPVAQVTRGEAAAACAALDARLPTEAEWERAARGATGRRYPWGDVFEPWRGNTVLRMVDRPIRTREDWLAFVERARQAGKSPTLSPAGGAPGDATPEGIVDLHGNVMEWVAGVWAPARGSSLMGGDGVSLPAANDRLGIVRGVSVISRDFGAPAAARFPLPLEWRAENLGWRCARSVTPPR